MFEVLKTIKIGDKEYLPGEYVEKTDDGRDWLGIERLGLVKTINNPAELAKIVETKTVDEPITEINLVPEIVKDGVWFKVIVDGEQIGKATRSREEAEATLDEWLESA